MTGRATDMRSSLITILQLFSTFTAVTCAAQVQPTAVSQQNEVTAGQVVTALEGAYGVHAGQRRNHTKGTCALGTFVGATEAGGYSRSALFSGGPVRVVARFSLAGGNPKAPDADRSPRAWRWSSGYRMAAF